MEKQQRLIDADAFEEKLKAFIGGTTIGFVLVGALRNEPSIEAEPVRHGRWATDEEDIKWGNSLKRKHCTNCGKRPHFDKEKREFILTDYCPHCGAKMDGGAEDD